jgi:hypothetical protein
MILRAESLGEAATSHPVALPYAGGAERKKMISDRQQRPQGRPPGTWQTARMRMRISKNCAASALSCAVCIEEFKDDEEFVVDARCARC